MLLLFGIYSVVLFLGMYQQDLVANSVFRPGLPAQSLTWRGFVATACYPADIPQPKVTMSKLNTGEFIRIRENNACHFYDGDIVLNWYVRIYLFDFCRNKDTRYTLGLARLSASSTEPNRE